MLSILIYATYYLLSCYLFIAETLLITRKLWTVLFFNQEAAVLPLQMMSKMVNSSMPNISIGQPRDKLKPNATVTDAMVSISVLFIPMAIIISILLSASELLTVMLRNSSFVWFALFLTSCKPNKIKLSRLLARVCAWTVVWLKQFSVAHSAHTACC